MTDAIRTEAVVKDFGKLRALDHVSIEIEQGELFFLLGGSGCGKTTLLRCIAGLEEPTEGKVFFGDEDVTRLPAHKREAAMVFQSYALWPHMSVGQNIAFGLEERKVPKPEIKERVEEVLKMVRMEGFEKRGIDQMSGGQQQRVSLARALVVRPKCLLLDEPLSNLDAQLRLEMRSEIRRIVKENDLTGVYVTHDQEEALSMADRLAVMDSGRVVQVGTPQEVYRNPNCSYVAEFIGETNLLEGKVKGKGSNGSVEVETAAGVVAGRLTVDDWKPGAGEQATVAVRPEALKVVDADGAMKGWIAETVYLGDLIQYRVVTDSGVELQVAEMNPHVVREAGEDTIGIEVNREDVVVLKY
ncbi:MAG: ABC transporter ATP-binding protein [Akkermansiaceae bacterium]|nr:ABC transporter ATP-binding protein [Akkermansiaceae bacterium]